MKLKLPEESKTNHHPEILEVLHNIEEMVYAYLINENEYPNSLKDIKESMKRVEKLVDRM